MRVLPAIGVVLLLLLLALVLRAPATLFDSRLEAASAGRLRLANAAGTVWNGSGDVRIVAGDSAIPVTWHVAAWPLLRGRLRGSLVTDDATAPADFDVGGGDFDIRNLSLTLPAQSILRGAGAPALASAGGTMRLRATALAKRGDSLDGDLNLRWSKATLGAVGMMPDVALGEVRFDGTGQSGALNGTLSNEGGEVDISGTASVSLDGRGRISATLRARTGLDPERAKTISRALATVGAPDADGGYRFVWP